MHLHRAHFGLVGIVLLGTLLPVPATAQVVRGTLVDDTGLGPVATATVTLIRGDDRLSSAITDSRGFFFLEVPYGGHYKLEAERLGYETTESQPFLVEAGDTVTVEFRIDPDAVLLKPIMVTARSNAGRNQFRRRMEDWGKGIFVTPDMVDSIRPRHPADVMRNQEDVWLSWGWGTSSSGMSGPVPRIHTFQSVGCMRYSLNGIMMRRPFDSEGGPWTRYPLDGLRGEEVVAVEIYRSLHEAAPEVRKLVRPEHALDPALCGLTIFWTRAGW